jgi:antitoxin MazE
MKAVVGKWGKSIAVRLPKDVQERLGLKAGDEVELTVDQGRLTVAPRREVYDPEGYLKRIRDQEPPEQVDWGPATGREVW